MAVTVTIEPEDELTPRERRDVVADVNLFIALRNRLARSELRTLRHELANVVVIDEAGSSHPATGEPMASAPEQSLLAFRSLLQLFEARRDLLDDALTATQAAELLEGREPLDLLRDRELEPVKDAARAAAELP
jgi:hypothetical protein